MKTFPDTYVPVIVNGTETDVPAQKVEGVIAPVEMPLCVSPKAKNLFPPMLSEAVTPLVPVVPLSVV